MKKFGIISIIIGAIGTIGAISIGHNPTGPIFWLILGVILVIRANGKNTDIDENKKYNQQ